VSVLARAILLMALWLLAWGEITIANLMTGAAVITALLLAFPPGATTRVRMNPAAVTRLAGYVVVQLVSSNILMTREILRRRPTVRPGVLAHRLRQPSDYVVTLMTSIIALSPGTMTVDVDQASTTIYVHFLFLHDVDAARASLERLERVIALNGLVLVGMGGIATHAAHTAVGAFLPALVAIALVGPIGNGMIARFIEERQS
jgi:multicomponent Na+:H+ antiporter subunit E